MTRFLLDYQRERAELRQAQARARKTHPKGCDCPYCMTAARAAELLALRVAAEPERNGEPPF